MKSPSGKVWKRSMHTYWVNDEIAERLVSSVDLEHVRRYVTSSTDHGPTGIITAAGDWCQVWVTAREEVGWKQSGVWRGGAAAAGNVIWWWYQLAGLTQSTITTHQTNSTSARICKTATENWNVDIVGLVYNNLKAKNLQHHCIS